MTDVRMFAVAAAAIAAILAAPPAGRAAEAAVDLQVIVPNLKSDGPVVISLYNDPGAWAAEGKPYRSVTATVENGMAMARFKAPSGRYAIAAFQDRNGDGQLNLLPFRWPGEKVGFSGGVRPLVGRPAWDKADFGLTLGERMTVFVRLK